MNFKEVVGNKRQVEILRKDIRSNRINHFYLFEGEEGTGKTDLALAFSKAILCKTSGSDACDQCDSCIKFNTRNHPDFKMLSPTKGFIRRDEVVEMIQDISIIPFEGGKKVFLIEGLDVTRTETQNLLLKTLEEPPSYVIIIIVTSNPNKILPTILSRCQRISFYNKNKMEDLMDSDDYHEMRDELVDIVDNLIKGNQIKVFSSTEFFSKNKDKITELLDIMLYWFRDLAIYKETREDELILNKDKIEKLQAQSSLDINRIYDIIYKIEKTKANIDRNVNFNLSIETMLLNI